MTPETQQMVVLRSVQPGTVEFPQQSPPVPPVRRARMAPIITRTALATVGFGMCIGFPMLHPSRYIDTFVAPPATTSPYGIPSSPPVVIAPSDVPIPINTPQPEAVPPRMPSPVPIVSICETQAGTREGQLPGGTAVLPATMNRPSIFVVSPDRSATQSFSVRPANDSSADWSTIFEADNVGIVGITTADLEFDTGERAVWAKSCEPTSLAAVEEVRSRTDDLCRRREFGFTEVVVYHVGTDGKPVEMDRADC